VALVVDARSLFSSTVVCTPAGTVLHNLLRPDVLNLYCSQWCMQLRIEVDHGQIAH
jgi:hypothetical protein